MLHRFKDPDARWIAINLAFLAIILMITPLYILGDFAYYVDDVLAYARNKPGDFWEFGHVLWRPLGYFAWSLAGASILEFAGKTERQGVALLFSAFSLASAFGAVVLLYRFLRSQLSPSLAGVLAITFSSTSAVLNYSRAGTPYMPGLFFLLASANLIVRPFRSSRESPELYWAIGAGLSYAISIMLWFPYAFLGLGLVTLWSFRKEEDLDTPGLLWRRFAAFVVAAGLASGLVFAMAGWLHGVRDWGQLRSWVVNSGHTMSGGANWARFLTGAVRGVYELGQDTLWVKRWFFGSGRFSGQRADVVVSLAIRLILFYGASLLIVLRAIKTCRARCLLVWFSSLIPMLVFAVIVFEPSSPERFLPLFPFALLTAGICIQERWSSSKAVRCFVLIVVASVPLLNVTKTRSEAALDRDARLRYRSKLNELLSERAAVVVTGPGEILAAGVGNPLDDAVRGGYFTVPLVRANVSEERNWKSRFAGRAFENWRDGKEVWISATLLAPDAPETSLWVEGNDPNLRWRDFAEFFNVLDIVRPARHSDSFVLVAETPRNVKILLRELK